MLNITHMRQNQPRSCGGAALAMIYNHFGMSRSEDQIWQARHTASPTGSNYISIQAIIVDAKSNGLDAVAIAVINSRRAIQALSDANIPAILLQRKEATGSQSHYGHFRVSAGIAPGAAGPRILDPLKDRPRTIPFGELNALWTSNQEVPKDHALIALMPASAAHCCTACGMVLATTINCSRCSASVGLTPHAAIGCMQSTCDEKIADHILCPACDVWLLL